MWFAQHLAAAVIAFFPRSLLGQPRGVFDAVPCFAASFLSCAPAQHLAAAVIASFLARCSANLVASSTPRLASLRLFLHVVCTAPCCSCDRVFPRSLLGQPRGVFDAVPCFAASLLSCALAQHLAAAVIASFLARCSANLEASSTPRLASLRLFLHLRAIR